MKRTALLAFVLVLASPPAFAEDEIDALEKQLAQEHAALSTSDCTTACRALSSIRRAADKICALDPGTTRCTSAKAKADDATRRVREACPDCAVAQAPGTQAPPPAEPASVMKPAESEKRGGCAGCATTSTNGADSGWILAVAWAVSRLGRKSRRRL
jgi:hypothetical protein